MSLTSSVASSIRWTSTSMVITTAIQIIQLSVLARVISPEEFGLMSMVVIVTGLAQLLGQMGFSEAIVQRQNPTRLELSSLFWFSIAISLIIYAVMLMSSPLVSIFYSSPELESLLPWLALSVLIIPWGSQSRALMQKRLLFKPIGIIDILASIIGALVATNMAWLGCGVWSLIFGNLAQVSTTALLFLVYGWRSNFLPGRMFDPAALRPYLAFSSHMVGSNLLNYINTRVDQLMIGALLGPVALGYYSIAFNLVIRPVSQINPVITRVALPVLVKLREDNRRLKQGYFKILELLTSINAPVLLGLVATSSLLVPALLGDQWTPVVPVVQVLACYSLLRSIGNAGGSLVLAVGRADMAFNWNLALFVLTPFAVLVGAFLGELIGVAFALLALQFMLVFLWYATIVRTLLGNCLAGFLNSLAKPLLLSSVMAGTVLLFSRAVALEPPIVKFILEVCLGIVMYVVLHFIFRRSYVKLQWQMLKG